MRHEAADGGELPLLVFEPDTRPRAGIVLFHGGALRSGSADMLAPHCRALAARGVLAVSAGYRLLGQGAASIDDCVADVRQAVQRFGELAAVHALDVSRLAWGGSSAGAHLALVIAMTGPGAGAVVALNPAGLDLGSLEPESRRQLEDQAGIAAGRLLEYEHAAHGFHHPGDSRHFDDVIDATARFLLSG